jgi:hypothetical protein
MNISKIWRRVASGRYTRELEHEAIRLRGEVERLRAENRALLNSILGIAGVPPIPADIPTSCVEPPLSAHPVPRPGPEAPPSGSGTSPRGARRALRASGVQMAGASRKRSWQQISRMLEFEAGREEKQ